jgi:hypothetical protein
MGGSVWKHGGQNGYRRGHHCPSRTDDPRAIGEAVRRWDGLELEEATNRAGLQATMVRTVEEFMAEEQFRYLAAMGWRIEAAAFRIGE